MRTKTDYPRFQFKAKLWLYPGEGAWHFVTLPKALSKLIRVHFKPLGKGFGSVRVQVSVGSAQWKSSIFPSKELNAFVLPVKAAVRRQAGLSLRKSAAYTIEILI